MQNIAHCPDKSSKYRNWTNAGSNGLVSFFPTPVVPQIVMRLSLISKLGALMK